jgi:putative transcriptional regulator
MDSFSLTDHFLIAMPNMTDPHFAGAVVYLCEHSEHGAMGVVVNKPAEVTLGELFDQIDLPLLNPEQAGHPVYLGGPVQTDRGFVLHQPLDNWNATLAVNDDTGLTTSRDVLVAVSQGDGPYRMLITLGYAGWGAGQLEQELAQNAWLTVPANLDCIYGQPPEARFAAAMQLLGFDPLALSGEAGHA